MKRIENLPLDTLRRIERVCDAFEVGHYKDIDFEAHLVGFDGIEREALVAELVKIDVELRSENGWPLDRTTYARLSKEDRAVCETVLASIGAVDIERPKGKGRSSPGAIVVKARPVRGPQEFRAAEQPLQSKGERRSSGKSTDLQWPYELGEIIGRGGMGTVYLATQRRPVVRSVALKIIQAVTPAPEILKRFELERQALAVMDHANIAKVFDAGRTPEGRPFFSMEYVQGSAVTEYCEQNELSLRVRLQLFVQICNAVQHAHQKGIIHRDLKPSNVLVSAQDGNPQVKVIDFGLAKAVHGTSAATASSLHTQYGQVMGTLAYMSPEQAELSNLDIDTRTDVYSLGALLFELLVGSTPITKTALGAASFLDALKMVQNVDTPRPSFRLNENTATRRLIARRCGTTHQRYTKILATDLDWIVLKALEKNPSERYQTPAALASDVVKFVRGEPVDATPPSTVYRFTKSYKKNRLFFNAASVVLATLVLGLLGTVGMWLQSVDAEKRASTSATSATAEAKKARAAESAERNAKREMRDERDRALRAEADVRRVNSRMNFNLAVARWESGRALEALEYLDKVPENERDIEWFVAKRHFLGSDMTLYGHDDPIKSVEASSNGNFLASADGITVKIWNAITGLAIWESVPGSCVAIAPDCKTVAIAAASEVKLYRLSEDTEGRNADQIGNPLASFRHASGKRITSLAWLPNSQEVLAGCQDGTVQVYNRVSKRIRTLKAHDETVIAIKVAPLGREFVTYGRKDDIVFWNTEELSRSREIPAHRITNTDVSLSPDGNMIATVGRDGYFCTLRLLEVTSLRQVWARKFNIDDYLDCVAFSPDGGRIAIGASNRKVSVLDVTDGKTLRELVGHWGRVTDVCFSTEGFRVISGGSDGTVKSWNADGFASIRFASRQAMGTVSALAFSDEGEQLAAADNRIRVWSAAKPGRRVSAFRLPPQGSNASSLGFLRLIRNEQVEAVRGDQIFRWEVAGKLVEQLQPYPGGRVLARSRSGEEVVFKTNARLSIWHVERRQEVASFKLAGPEVVLAAFVLGDSAVLACDRNGACEVLDIASKQRLILLKDVGIWPDGCWPNEDGRLLAATTDFGRNLKIFDLVKRKQVTTFAGHTGRISGVVFGPSGKRVITVAADRTMRFWDVENGEELLSLEFEDEYRSVAISPDKRRIAFGSQYGTVGLVDIVHQQNVTTLAGHKDVVRNAFLGPREEKAYTASDSEHFVWDVKSGKRLDEPWPNGAYAMHVERGTRTQSRYYLTKNSKTVVLADLSCANGETEQSFRLARSTPSPGYFQTQIARASERDDPYSAAVLAAWKIYQAFGAVDQRYLRDYTEKLDDAQKEILSAVIEQIEASNLQQNTSL
ncbi:MAG: hypothetical protein Aurels2KO_29720 [Aureliella sp.]